MRRLLALVSGVVLVETIFFTVLTPLLPQLADEFDLSKSESGLLTAAYALGAFAGAIPAGMLSTRWGVRATVLVGLGFMSAATLMFALADSVLLLNLARLVQGGASAFCWNGAMAWLVYAAPRQRRGELIGIALSAAVGGAILGPVVGGGASYFGRAPVFSGVAVLALVLAVWALRTTPPPLADRQPARLLLRAVREPTVLAAMWLLVLPSLLLGVLAVLPPLKLDSLGWGTLGISGIFLVAALLEASASPMIGRWSDRKGRLAPVRYGLAASTVILLMIPWVVAAWPLAILLGAATLAYGMFWTPAMAMLSDGTEAAGIEHALGLALMNFAWAPGAVLGAAAGGALADVSSDVVPFSVLAGACLGTLVLFGAPVRGRALRHRPAGTAERG